MLQACRNPRRRPAATLLLALLSCAIGPARSEPATDQWQQELLLQLSELRKAQGDLRQQVTALQAQLQALEDAGKPPPVSLDLSNDAYPVLGDKNANVAIVEFADFECPYCRRHQQNTLPGLTDKYLNGGKVKYVYLNFPLGFHARAEPAAIAGACAAQQGAFWPMSGKLYENQAALVPETFARLAGELDLNADQFARCQQDPAIAAAIREQIRLGESVGVQGTPAFIIGKVRDGVLSNATLVSGAQPLRAFEQALDPLLASDGKRQ